MSIDTETFRAALLEERLRVEHAIARLRETDDDVDEVAGIGDNHLADTATATLDREIESTLEENSGRMLAAIDAALRRIDDGAFGRCANCGQEIGEQRLEAYPWAALCIDCQRHAERT